LPLDDKEPGMADSSSVSVLGNIFTAPSLAFAAIKERPNPWLPLLVLVIGYCVVSFLYLQVVDLPWLMDRQLAQAGGNMTEQQRAEAVEAALRISPTVYGAIGAVSTSLSIVAIFALVALYLTGVSFATNDGVKFRQWFAMIVWSSMPAVFGLLATFVNLLVNDARFLPQEQLNPLSFGNFLAVDSEGLPVVQRILLSLDLTTVWGVVLQVIGYQLFTQRSIARAAIVVLGPLALLVLMGVIAAL
jgi:hypothetical protein